MPYLDFCLCLSICLSVSEEWPSEEGEPGQEPKPPTTNGETSTQEEKG